MASLRRSIKNTRKGFAPCECDVRDATSNDKSMASGIVMARIANATYDATASPMVMKMIWTRLNDVGKKWRHVYKALYLLDYLLKTGAEHVVAEVKANRFALQSLTEFRYVNPKNIDKGINVREQAKETLRMLDDTEGLAALRIKAMQQHRRFTEANGKKAQAKITPHTRANKFSKKANVMPNGEVAPDLREQEAMAIRNAQQESFNEFASSAAGQQAVIQSQSWESPTQQRSAGNPGAIGAFYVHPSSRENEQQTVPATSSASNGGMSEDEALAYAMRISTIESGGTPTSNYQAYMNNSAPQLSPAIAAAPQAWNPPQPSPPTANSSAAPHDAMTPEEEEQLAIALSLSLAEVQGINNVLGGDSDDESNGEITPPSTPYQGDHFNQQVTIPEEDGVNVSGYMTVSPAQQNIDDELPTYEQSFHEMSPGTTHHAILTSEMDQMAQFLDMNDSVGAETAPAQTYLNVEPVNQHLPPDSVTPIGQTDGDSTDEEL